MEPARGWEVPHVEVVSLPNEQTEEKPYGASKDQARHFKGVGGGHQERDPWRGRDGGDGGHHAHTRPGVFLSGLDRKSVV